MGKVTFPGGGGLSLGFGKNSMSFPGGGPSGITPLPSQDPDAAAISGELRYWFNNTSLSVATPGQSGLDGWDDLSQYNNTIFDIGTPSVASGEINGLDAAYVQSSKQFFDDTPVSAQITGLQGTDKPISFFGVCRADDTTSDLGAIFSACRNIDANDGQRIWGVHTAGGGQLFYFERDDVNVDWRNFGGSSTDLNNKVTANELFLFSSVTSADGTTWRGFKNGVEWTETPSGLEVGAVTPQDIGIGINARAALDWDLKGMICEIVVYSSGMDDSNRAMIEQGLMNKWGI